jgi:acylphosphatase
MVEITVQVTISGRVQGVWFRDSTRRMADSLGIYGWVKNNDDGKVEALFQGKPEKINEILDWCKKGPPLSRVDKVKVSETSLDESYDDFTIL